MAQDRTFQSAFSDQSTTLSQIKETVKQFVLERDWKQFHAPKNLAMALSVEAAELTEHFQWLTIEESRNINSEKRSEVADEMADVFCYLIAISNELGIDLAESFEKKMIKNRNKYPAEEIRGRFGHDDPNPVSDP